jgi:hypothetical protein
MFQLPGPKNLIVVPDSLHYSHRWRVDDFRTEYVHS